MVTGHTVKNPMTFPPVKLVGRFAGCDDIIGIEVPEADVESDITKS